jgi:hypothetical protein
MLENLQIMRIHLESLIEFMLCKLILNATVKCCTFPPSHRLEETPIE